MVTSFLRKWGLEEIRYLWVNSRTQILANSDIGKYKDALAHSHQ